MTELRYNFKLLKANISTKREVTSRNRPEMGYKKTCIFLLLLANLCEKLSNVIANVVIEVTILLTF